MHISADFLTSAIQILGDCACLILSLFYIFRDRAAYRAFFVINSISFFALFFSDAYYDLAFRIFHMNIQNSAGFLVAFPLFAFQILQAFNWYSLIRENRYSLLRFAYVPFWLFFIFIIFWLGGYFTHTQDLTGSVMFWQIIHAVSAVLAWFGAILCLANTRVKSIGLMALGCLMVVSSDLAINSLFMLHMNEVVYMSWVQVIWALGVVLMAVGLYCCSKKEPFAFHQPDSIQATAIGVMLVASLLAFFIGFIFFVFLQKNVTTGYQLLGLWAWPIGLLAVMIIATLLAKWLSNIVLNPLDGVLQKIHAFSSGQQHFSKKPEQFYEFRDLNTFLDDAFKKLSVQLDNEVKLAAQVAHDIRSPLAALEMLSQLADDMKESKRILLRGAAKQIRDITNNLAKKDSEKNREKSILTQISVLLGYVVSERRVALVNKEIEILENFSADSYGLFVEIMPSVMRRVVTNLINNAYESIQTKGKIVIAIEKCLSHAVISIRDNGPGVKPELLPTLFTRGLTTKKEGSGLGLYHAKESILSMGGSIEFILQQSGALIEIKLPIQASPHWFCDQLLIPKNATVVCVDDSISIWHSWQERFRSYEQGMKPLLYCPSKDALLKVLSEQSGGNFVWLVDYEFSGKAYTGEVLIDIILSFTNVNSQVFLVTSRSEEEGLQKFCESRRVRIIPKFFVHKIPMDIS